MKDLALMGRAGAGKDTLAAMLCERDGYVRVAFADALKAMALAVDPIIDVWAEDMINVFSERLSEVVARKGWDAAKREYPEVRRFLQRLGKEGVRDVIGEDTWVRIARQKIDAARVAGRPVVVTDVRFRNELETLRALGFTSAWIARPGVGDGEHASEAELMPEHADLYVRNEHTPHDLYGKVRAVIAHVR